MAFTPRVSIAWRIWRRIVRTQVEHFAVPAILPAADVLKLSDLPARFAGAPNVYRPTILIDLQQPEETLWDAMASQARKGIRQAMRQNIVVERIPELTEEIWNAFLAAYWGLWHRKHNAGALGIGQIRDLITQGRFALSRSRDLDGNMLSWHAYVRTPERARLHTTISDMDPARGSHWNNLVGRAHKLHHWQDMLQFKSEGVQIYDFGGVYRGSEDQEQINIARFKQLFGGHFADTYDAVVPLTLKGRLALSLLSHVSAEARAGGRVAGVPA
jgi:hypothetical protein